MALKESLPFGPGGGRKVSLDFPEAGVVAKEVGMALKGSSEVAPDSTCQEFLKFVELMEGAIPPEFYRVFLLAQNLERLAGGDGLRKLGSSGKKKETGEKASVHGVPVLSESYRVEPVLRPAEGIEDLMLLSPEELLGTDFGELVRRVVQDQDLQVWDLQLEPPTQASLIKPIPGVEGQEFLKNEQAIILLLDLSYSMRNNSRLLLAQAISLWYLTVKYIKQGVRPLFHMRGFAVDVGALVRAENMADLPTVVNEILAADARQRGTDIENVLLQAGEDIRYYSLARSEILLVTDGLCAVDLDKIRAALPGGTKINVVKIGDDEIAPTAAQIVDLTRRWEGGEDEAKKRLNASIKADWAALSDELIELPDIGAVEMDADFVANMGEILRDTVFNCDFAEAPLGVRRQAVFLNDLLVHALNSSDVNVNSVVRAAAVELQEKLAQWLAPGVSVEVEARLESAQQGKVKPTSLRLGSHKVGVGLSLFKRAGNGPKVMINTLEVIWKLLVALAKKAVGRG